MKSGDRVTVTVLGERVGGIVENPYTELGDVQVKLDAPVMIAAVPVQSVVRARSDVIAWRCEECRMDWRYEDDRCSRCGNRTRVSL